MIHSEINSNNTDSLCENSVLFNQYMRAQIHEIESFLTTTLSESDKNKMAIIWIEKNADQFRTNWSNTH